MPVINDIKKLFNLQFYSQDGNLIYSQKRLCHYMEIITK